MKKLVPHIATVVAVALSVFSLFRIFGLKDEIRRMENNFNNQLSMMQSNHNAVLSQVEERLEQHASILTQKDFTYGEMSMANQTVKLMATITPKEHQPDVTKAFLIVNDNEYPMELTNGAYQATVDLPIFEESSVKQVVFREGDIIRTETLNRQFTPRYELLPSIDARLSGSGRGSAQNGVYTWRRNGKVRVSVEGKGQIINIQSVSLMEELDGVETGRIEIPLTNTQSSNARRESAVPEPVRPGTQINGSEIFYYDLNKDFSIPFGSTMNLFAEVVDGNGLTYRVCIEHWEIDEKGEPVDDDAWAIRYLLEQIIGPDGEILYEVDEKQYR